MDALPAFPALAKSRVLLWAVPLLALAAVVIGMGVWKGNKAAALLQADPERLLSDPALRDYAIAAGRSVYHQHCESCHGPTGKGDRTIGAPDLTDDIPLYREGTVAQLEEIVRYGIRAGNKRGWNLAVMPAFGRAKHGGSAGMTPQTPRQIEELTQFLLSFTGRATDAAAAQRGHDTYNKAGCWDCHGRDVAGDPAIGAPGLTGKTWLYGGRPEDIRRTISQGRAGFSPAFANILAPAEQRADAVYVASLAQTKVDVK